ncbi:uncharacterized protein EV420DRAFT_256438 [Desarmillaria tabescens]|uniref:Uncharacterized protein n=1 Tax=Armillaria tabescens TaxID=1929756 RepID=A0AA39N7D8_ARMTA|nr:uncharacterized protein EV420DRAFT_256438 [Desarmillaria tabescens]KAK0460250.1 hypothetical protein EV420DRAFT_256438 [Desarmillaria tabescens]
MENGKGLFFKVGLSYKCRRCGIPSHYPLSPGVKMGHGPSRHKTYPVSPAVGHAGACPFCSGTTPDSDEPESSSTSLGKRMIDDNDITSIFMIAGALLGMLLLIAAFIVWRRRNREISVIENEILHTTTLPAQVDLEGGSNGKMTLDFQEAPPAYYHD